MKDYLKKKKERYKKKGLHKRLIQVQVSSSSHTPASVLSQLTIVLN